MQKIAIFDVDYTLTKKETLVEFYKFMVKKKPILLLHIFKIIIMGILYMLRIINFKKAKEYMISFINGIEEKDMKNIVEEFYRKKLSRILYKDAIDTMKKLKSEGYKIFLISASAEFYLNELYNIKEVDKIIGTRVKVENGRYIRGFEGENCKGEEKVKRLLEELKKEKMDVNFKDSFAFSDSLSDLPLFKLVGHPYLINGRKNKNNVEILKWR